MAKKAHKQQGSALDEVRRHVRIFIDLGRVASESADEEGFLDQVVVQVARAVEIDHVKVAWQVASRMGPVSRTGNSATVRHAPIRTRSRAAKYPYE
jgi:hypothetical protein